MVSKLIKVGVISLLLGIGHKAWSLPPPDKIETCRINKSLQVHQWNHVDGKPETLYFKIGNHTNPFGPWEFKKISEEEFAKQCRNRIGHEDIMLTYEDLDESIFEEELDEPLFSVLGVRKKSQYDKLDTGRRQF